MDLLDEDDDVDQPGPASQTDAQEAPSSFAPAPGVLEQPPAFAYHHPTISSFSQNQVNEPPREPSPVFHSSPAPAAEDRSSSVFQSQPSVEPVTQPYARAQDTVPEGDESTLARGEPSIPDETHFKARVAKLRTNAQNRDQTCAFPDALIEHFLTTSGCELAEKGITNAIGIEVQNALVEVLLDVKAASSLKFTAESKRKKPKTDASAAAEDLLVLQSSQLQTAFDLRKIPAAYAPFHPISDNPSRNGS